MAVKWIRFNYNNAVHYGVIEDNSVRLYSGSPFYACTPTDEVCSLEDVTLLAPCQPTKIVALWNNFYALAEKQNHDIPESPYYFIKPSSCVIGTNEAILPPPSYPGRIFYEGELGVVIGSECKSVNESEVREVVLGYTCVNDVTATQLIHEKEAYPQWTRAKSFDTFGAIGPCISTLSDPTELSVITLVNGRERQNYPVADMIFSPEQLVSIISADMTLYPGDVIACGTSLGALPMKPGTKVEVVIKEIGSLENVFFS